MKIHPLETAVLWAVSAHLVFLPWAIGGMRLWAQNISLVLAALGFVLSLVPRNYSEEHTGTNRFRLLTWPKLVRFPIFWLGLALLGLVLTQALNPAWRYETDSKNWWIVKIAHLSWLPSGVAAPFERWGPWRMLMIYSSAWLTVCAMWIGFTRRRTVQRFLIVLSVNALALSAFGIAERMFGNGKLYWVWLSANPSFFSSFVYKNHAGAYLLLCLSVACGLGAWYYLRGVRRLEKSNPSGVFAFFATCIAVSILVSYARGATLTMLIYLCVVVGAFLFHQWRLPAESRRPVIAIVLVLIFGFFLKTGMNALQSRLAWDRLREALSGQDVSVRARQIANQASLDMLGDYWQKGTGAGGFRFVFPYYQQHYPEIFAENGRRMFWEHAHNDVLEFPIELGIPGMLLILGGFISWAVVLTRFYFWQNPLSASVILGCLFMLGFAWGDFIFQNPAVLITWCALWPACALWAQMEEQRGRS